MFSFQKISFSYIKNPKEAFKIFLSNIFYILSFVKKTFISKKIKIIFGPNRCDTHGAWPAYSPNWVRPVYSIRPLAPVFNTLIIGPKRN